MASLVCVGKLLCVISVLTVFFSKKSMNNNVFNKTKEMIRIVWISLLMLKKTIRRKIMIE